MATQFHSFVHLIYGSWHGQCYAIIFNSLKIRVFSEEMGGREEPRLEEFYLLSLKERFWKRTEHKKNVQ